MTRAPPETERAPIQAACAILGKQDRTVRALASSGQLPGAAKIGGAWTFNLVKLRAYVDFKEREACQNARPQRAVSGAVKRSGGAFKPAAVTSSGHYAQTIQRLRQAADRRNAADR